MRAEDTILNAPTTDALLDLLLLRLGLGEFRCFAPGFKGCALLLQAEMDVACVQQKRIIEILFGRAAQGFFDVDEGLLILLVAQERLGVSV